MPDTEWLHETMLNALGRRGQKLGHYPRRHRHLKPIPGHVLTVAIPLLALPTRHPLKGSPNPELSGPSLGAGISFPLNIAHTVLPHQGLRVFRVALGTADVLAWRFDSLSMQYDLKRHTLACGSKQDVECMNRLLMRGITRSP